MSKEKVRTQETSATAPSVGWSWPSLAPGSGLPIAVGAATSVHGPMPTGRLYAIVVAGWIVLGVLGILVAVRVVLLVLALLGIVFGHADSSQTQLL